MKVLIVNNQFSIGGAARVASVQCNILHQMGVDIKVVTDNINWGIDYDLNHEIAQLSIDVNPKKASFIQKISKLIKCVSTIRKYIKSERPDAVIAIQADMFFRTYLAHIGIKIPLIVADHTSFTRKQDFITDFVRYHLYKQANAISILTHKDEKILGQKYPQKRVIYNPLTYSINNLVVERKKNILCVGRLDVWHIKGFDIILDIWSNLHSLFPEWILEIAGSGDDKSISFIENRIKDLNLSHRVKLLGQITNMKDLYLHSSIFALPSRIEGFPMALMEAMSQGCACIAFNVDGAASEMLGNAGIIIEDGNIEQFKHYLKQLLSVENKRFFLGQKAQSEVSRFSVECFGTSWLNLINDTIKTYNR